MPTFAELWQAIGHIADETRAIIPQSENFQIEADEGNPCICKVQFQNGEIVRWEILKTAEGFLPRPKSEDPNRFLGSTSLGSGP